MALTTDEALEALGELVSQAGGEGDDALDLFKDAVSEVRRVRRLAMDLREACQRTGYPTVPHEVADAIRAITTWA